MHANEEVGIATTIISTTIKQFMLQYNAHPVRRIASLTKVV